MGTPAGARDIVPSPSIALPKPVWSLHLPRQLRALIPLPLSLCREVLHLFPWSGSCQALVRGNPKLPNAQSGAESISAAFLVPGDAQQSPSRASCLLMQPEPPGNEPTQGTNTVSAWP